ncbi:MAG: ATP-binding protein [Planctomycetaceae bacterium]
MIGLSIRTRLTLWYGLSMAIVLIVFCFAIHIAAKTALLNRLDAALREELREICVEIEISATRTTFLEAANSRFYRHDAYDFLIVDDQQNVVFRSAGVSEEAVRPLMISLLERSVEDGCQTADVDGAGACRVVQSDVESQFGSLNVVALTSMLVTSTEMAAVRSVLLWLYPASLIPSVLGGYLLASRAVLPIRMLSDAAKTISIHSLDARVPVSNPFDEIGVLATTLNGFLARLETAVHEIQRFTADASHELRTPIAALQAEAELALSRSRTPEEYIAALQVVVEEARRLGKLSDQLLVLSRNDAGCHGADTSQVEIVDLEDLAGEAIDELRLKAAASGIFVKLDVPTPCRLVSEAGRLRQILINLLENAIKYSSEGSTVVVSLADGAAGTEVTVSDCGAGIAPAHLPHVFERFYRADSGRSTEGTGLGLAIVKSHVDSLGGSVSIQSRVGNGTIVSVLLPGRRLTANSSVAAIPERSSENPKHSAHTPVSAQI